MGGGGHYKIGGIGGNITPVVTTIETTEMFRPIMWPFQSGENKNTITFI
jgi:hypothetical protein